VVAQLVAPCPDTVVYALSTFCNGVCSAYTWPSNSLIAEQCNFAVTLTAQESFILLFAGRRQTS